GRHVRYTECGVELQLPIHHEGSLVDSCGRTGRAVVRKDRDMELCVLRQRGAGATLGAGGNGIAPDAAAEEAPRAERERGGGRGVASEARGSVVTLAR